IPRPRCGGTSRWPRRRRSLRRPPRPPSPTRSATSWPGWSRPMARPTRPGAPRSGGRRPTPAPRPGTARRAPARTGGRPRRPQAAALREAVQVKALDDRRLQVTLRAPNPAWPLYTAHPALAPRRADLPFGAVTNGPFVLVHAGPALAGPADGRTAPTGAAGSAP